VNNLEILYQARGEEIKRLKSDLSSVADSKTSELRQVLHEVALLKAENGRLKANLVTTNVHPTLFLTTNSQQRCVPSLQAKTHLSSILSKFEL